MTAAELQQATPATRDRYIDFLRVFSLIMVIVGHWLAVLVTWEDGQIAGENGLNVLPEMWPITWLLQVMPLFFFVGGYANRKSYESAVRRGGGYAAYLTGRLQRLLIPTLVFLAVGLTVATGLDLAGVMDDVLRPAARVVTLPLWFLGVYLMVVALAPPMLAAHRAYGPRLVLALAGTAVAVDWIRFAGGIEDVGHLNYAIVWLAVHQLGFLHADGSLQRWAGWLAGLGWGSVVMLIAYGPYPASLVGISSNAVDNMNPPTLVIGALAAGMTMFLWHLAAVLPTIAIVYPIGFPQPEPGSASFWMLRPIWVLLQVPVLVALVALFGRFEAAGRNLAGDLSGEGDSRVSRVVAGMGAVLAGLGVLGYARLGLEPFYSNVTRDLTAMDVNSARSLTHLLLALVLLRSAVRGPGAARRAAVLGAGVFGLLAMAGIGGWSLFATSAAETTLHAIGAVVLIGAAVSGSSSNARGEDAERNNPARELSLT
jgi:fucose 4-O-acetylase-like acetyltransferase